ncbi:hypothetical protein LJC32_03750, partial [Oscillospiraceae bacterium OttesenSCG-928-F05]|nr:hypothetical protein [Oscillospiraceae bacterium OttesenSCG-928-F05]
MKEDRGTFRVRFGRFLTKLGIGMRAKLIIIFLTVQVIPLILLTITASRQISNLGDLMRELSVEDASEALNASAVENIERMSTDTAKKVADFLYGRDDDILYLASVAPSFENYRLFSDAQTGAVVDKGVWELASDGKSWVEVNPSPPATGGGVSTNSENNDMDGFHYRPPETYGTTRVPLYDEITFIGTDGTELLKYVAPDSPKIHYPMDSALKDVSLRENTY